MTVETSHTLAPEPKVLIRRSLSRLSRARPGTALGVGRSALLAGAAVCTLTPTPTLAQWVESPLLRRGQVSAYITPFLTQYDERFGLRADGAEGVEALGADLTDFNLGSRLLPGVTGPERRFADLLQDSAWVLHLGSAQARALASVIRIPVGASIGVFDWLTVGGVAPFVRRRVDLDFLLDPARGNTGLSPGSSDPGVQLLLSQANGALASVTATVDQTCLASGETDPACVSGRAFLQEAGMFFGELDAAYAGPLFLFGGGSAASALSARVNAFRARMHQLASGAGIDTTFTAPLPFATAPLSIEQFQRFITDGVYGIAGDPLGPSASRWELGDIELFVALRLLGRDRAGRDRAGTDRDTLDEAEAPIADSSGVEPSQLDYLLTVQATYRMGTGTPASPQNILDIGSGDGLNDIEVRLFGRLDFGQRFRARAEAIYGVQLAGDIVNRVYGRDLPFASSLTQFPRRVDPGDYRSWLVAPEIRLTPELSLGMRYRAYHRAVDRYDASSVPESDALLLAAESEMNLTQWGAGVSFWPSTRSAEDGAWPVAITAEYLAPARGSGGQVPRGGQLRMQLRLFFQAW